MGLMKLETKTVETRNGQFSTMATRVPRTLQRALRLYAIHHHRRIQDVIAEALREALTSSRSRRGRAG